MTGSLVCAIAGETCALCYTVVGLGGIYHTGVEASRLADRVEELPV